MPTDATLPDQLAVLLSSSPELDEEPKDAVERTRAGALDPAVVRDIVSCALYRLNHSGVANVATKPPDQGSRKPVVLELFKQT